MIVETEITPNPDTLKFLPGKKVSEVGSLEFLKDDKNIKIPLARKILSLEGTVMVFFGENFITVKKDSKKNAKTSTPGESNEIINKINEVLDSKIRPAVARDGGDITFKSFIDGVVTVELKGSCSGCPSSIMTLKQGVQNLLCHYIPEVKSVKAV